LTHPPEARREQGDAAEERACRHLGRSGFTIVERKYRTKGGEIDIVARKGDVLVFVEVRSREVPGFGRPRSRSPPPSGAGSWAPRGTTSRPCRPPPGARPGSDVIAIEGTGDAAALRHYQAAFDAKGKIL